MKLNRLDMDGFTHHLAAMAIVVLFAIAGVGYLVASHADSVTPGFSWSGWRSLGGVTYNAPAAISLGGKDLEVFDTGNDNHIYEKVYSTSTGDFGGWKYLGETTYSSPGVAGINGGVTGSYFYLFVRGTNNNVYENIGDSGGGWSGWNYNYGGATYNAPAAVSRGTKDLQVFATGTDDHIWQSSYAGGGWQYVGGNTQSAPAVATDGTNIFLFARGTDNAVWENTYSGSWSGWRSLGGVTYRAPAAVSRGSKDIQVFVTGTDNHLWQNSYIPGGSWTGWHPVGGTTYSAPAVASDGSNLFLFARGTDNAVWENIGTPN